MQQQKENSNKTHKKKSNVPFLFSGFFIPNIILSILKKPLKKIFEFFIYSILFFLFSIFYYITEKIIDELPNSLRKIPFLENYNPLAVIFFSEYFFFLKIKRPLFF